MSTLLLALVVGLAVTILANVCTTVYLHRALAHQALTLAPPVVFVFRVLTWLTTGIQPATVGGRAPQTPRVHGQGGRPPSG